MIPRWLLTSLLLIGLGQHTISARQLEITPFTGWDLGGEFTNVTSGATLKVDDASSFGVIVDIGDTPESQVELFFSRQDTHLKTDNPFASSSVFDLDVDYYHVGGLIAGPDRKQKPFLAGTIGMTYLNPKPAGYSSESLFSFGIGGGIKYFMTERVGLRLEGRGLFSVVSSSARVFCGGGGCLIEFSGDIFWQLQFNAGLIFLLQ
jgi:hypothetical protein